MGTAQGGLRTGNEGCRLSARGAMDGAKTDTFPPRARPVSARPLSECGTSEQPHFQRRATRSGRYSYPQSPSGCPRCSDRRSPVNDVAARSTAMQSVTYGQEISLSAFRSTRRTFQDQEPRGRARHRHDVAPGVYGDAHKSFTGIRSRRGCTSPPRDEVPRTRLVQRGQWRS